MSNSFIKNILTVMTGTALAAAVPIAVSPILTRLYTPNTFGLFGSFTAIVALLSIIATFRYEIAIMLPKNKKLANYVAQLAIAIAIFASSIFLLIFLFSIPYIHPYIKINQNLNIIVILLIIALLINAILQSLAYLSNRYQIFKYLAKNRLIISTITAVSQLVLCQVAPELGLIFGYILGLTIGATLLLLKLHRLQLFNTIASPRVLKSIAFRYRKFPQYDILTTLMCTGSSQIPVLMLGMLFNPTISGYYYLTQRIIQTPINIISGSVLEVFKEKASRSIRVTGTATSVYYKTLLMLATGSLFFGLLIYLLIDEIIVFTFGPTWSEAGLYAKILLPAMMLRFISNPLGVMIYIKEKQQINLYMNTVLFIAIIATFFIAKTPEHIIIGLSLSYSFIYLAQIFISYNLAKSGNTVL